MPAHRGKSRKNPVNTTPQSTTENRLPGLEGLRGVACMMVFFYHLRWAAQPSNESPIVLPFGAEFLWRKFDIGVAIFFILSGLLLSLPFWRSILDKKPAPDTKHYLWRRACRIVPAYVAVLVAVYFLRGDTYTFYGAIDFILHATFLHNFADYAYHGPHPDLWTIGIEFQFYLLLPLIMAGVGAVYRKCGSFVAIATMIAGAWAAGAAVETLIGKAEPFVPDRFIAADGPVIGGTVFSYLKLFAFGIAAAFAVLRFDCSKRAADLACGAGIVATGTIVTFGQEGAWRSASTLGWPLNAIVLAVVAISLPKSEIFARVFSTRIVAATGTISYGIYLWHDLIQHAVFKGTLKGNLAGLPLFLSGGAIALFMTLIVATLSWHIIEKGTLRAPYPFTR
jgi:peptidoglycan/LPS O-acetylase OafA/YrhL